MTVMNDDSRPRLLALATILASLVIHTGAQSDVVPATCPADEEWAYNSANQSVCTVASNLAAVCNPQQIYTIPALSHPGDVYGGPLKGDECRCNSVFYSLLSACGLCQGYQYIKWSVFIGNCTDPKVGSYPEDIPQGTAVFDWAYADVLAIDAFNSTLAQSEPNAPESIFSAMPSSTFASATANPGPSATASAPNSKSSSNAGAIAGGLVGGLALLAMICLFALWLVKRRQRANMAIPINDAYSSMRQDSANPTMYSVHTAGQSGIFYNPSDPSTFPTSPVSGTIYTTQPDGASIAGRPVRHARTYSDGSYAGVPEL